MILKIFNLIHYQMKNYSAFLMEVCVVGEILGPLFHFCLRLFHNLKSLTQQVVRFNLCSDVLLKSGTKSITEGIQLCDSDRVSGRAGSSEKPECVCFRAEQLRPHTQPHHLDLRRPFLFQNHYYVGDL